MNYPNKTVTEDAAMTNPGAQAMLELEELLRRVRAGSIDAQHDIIEMFRARAVQGEPVAWRPIETAPRDGTTFLAIQRAWWTPANGNDRWVTSRVFESRWLPDKDKFWDDGHTPTHWASMPSFDHPAIGTPDNAREALEECVAMIRQLRLEVPTKAVAALAHSRQAPHGGQ